MKLPVTDGLNWKLPSRFDTKSSRLATNSDTSGAWSVVALSTCAHSLLAPSWSVCASLSACSVCAWMSLSQNSDRFGLDVLAGWKPSQPTTVVMKFDAEVKSGYQYEKESCALLRESCT